MKKEYRIKLLIRRKQITEKVAKELNVSEKTVY
jgi:DNA-binding CsgD family transcriptional regulator